MKLGNAANCLQAISQKGPYPDLSVPWCPGLCPLVLSPQSTDQTVNLCGLLISSSPYPQSAPLAEAESQMGHYAILDVFTQCAGYSSMSVTSDCPDLNFICLLMIPSLIVIKLICFDFHIHSFRISFCLLDLFLPLRNQFGFYQVLFICFSFELFAKIPNLYSVPIFTRLLVPSFPLVFLP